MDFDDMLEEIGEFGRFQITTYALICLPVLFAGANSLSYVFTAGVPNYRCFIPECEQSNGAYAEHWLPWAIPHENTSLDEYKPAQCLRYVRSELASNGTCHEDLFTTNVERCDTWIFDQERTIVNDWNITCFDNQWMLSMVGSSHFVGIIIGSAVFGFLADKYGRKFIFIFCILLMSVSGVAQIFSPGYITFTTLVFINALGTSGVYPLAFVIGVELVGRRKREATGIVLNYFYAIGEALVALFAWLTYDWTWVQLAASAPPILFGLYYWFIPESIRWLLAKDNNQKAKKILCRAAKMNNVVPSEFLLQSFNEEGNDKLSAKEEKSNDVFPVIKQIMRSRKLVIRFAVIFLIWAINAFVYYGLSVNSTSIGGNKYVNFALVCLVEIPGYTLALVAIKKVGRRLALIGSFLLCGITCTAAAFIDQSSLWAIVTLFLIGKMGVTSSFGVVYVHTAELLPTIIRSGGVGACSASARIGSLLAPFVPLLGMYVKPLPMLLFGGFATLAGLLAMHLPETLGTKLPETVEEAEKL